MAKQITLGEQSRAAILRGVNKLSEFQDDNKPGEAFGGQGAR